MEGLNLGLAVRMSDFASVNAQKISSSIEKLLKLADDFPHGAKRAGTAGDHLGSSLGHIDPQARKGAGGISFLSHSLNRATPNLVEFRAGIIRLFPYISIAAGVYAIKRGIDGIVEVSREFKSSLANLQAAAGYTGNETNWLEGQLRSLAKTSVFSAKEIADSAYDLGTIMEIPVQKLPPLQKAVLNYASATQFSVKETGLDILSLLTKMNKPLSDAPGLFDRMAYATNITSLTAKTLSEMIKGVGTEAIMMKLPFEEMLAVFGATDLQFRGGEGATRLRMIFQGLARDTKIHREVLSHYGLTMKDVDVKSQGFTKVMERLKGISYNDATRLVEGYSAGLLIQLTQATDKINEMQGKIERNAKGTTDRMKAIQLASLDGQLKLFKQTQTELQLTVNDSMEKPYARVLGKVNAFIVFLTDQIHKHKAVLDVLFNGIANVIEVIGGRVAKWIKGIMGWMGLMGQSTQETQGYIKNNLIPFVVWMEVMAVRTMNILGGFKDGFVDAAKFITYNIMLIARPFLWLFDFVFPKGSDSSYKLGYVLGTLAVGFITLSIAAKVATLWTALFGEVGLVSLVASVGRATWAIVGPAGLQMAFRSLTMTIGELGAATGASTLGMFGIVAAAVLVGAYLGDLVYNNWGSIVDWFGDKWNGMIIDFLKGMRIAAGIFDAILGTNFWKKADEWVQGAEDVQALREAKRDPNFSVLQFDAQRREKRRPKLHDEAWTEATRDSSGNIVLGKFHPAGERAAEISAQRTEEKRKRDARDQYNLDVRNGNVKKAIIGPTLEEARPYDDPAKRRGIDGGEWKISVDRQIDFTKLPEQRVLVRADVKQETKPQPKVEETVVFKSQPNLLGGIERKADMSLFNLPTRGSGDISAKSLPSGFFGKQQTGGVSPFRGPAVPSPTAKPDIVKRTPDLSRVPSWFKEMKPLTVDSPYASIDSLRNELKAVAAEAGDSFTFGDMNFYGIKTDNEKVMVDRVMKELDRRLTERKKR